VDGGQGEAVAFWDPQASTKKKWEETYATELQSRGLTQDFTGLSTLLLGQAQPAQFQTEGQTGYWWGSKVSDDGNFAPLDTISYQNSYSRIIPRSYTSAASKGLYNAVAATAESNDTLISADDTLTYYVSSDSICPAGWGLPGVSGATANPRFDALTSAYDVQANYSSGIEGFRKVLLLERRGYYHAADGRIVSVNQSATFFGDSQRGIVHGTYGLQPDDRYFDPYSYAPSLGLSVRCVKE